MTRQASQLLSVFHSSSVKLESGSVAFLTVFSENFVNKIFISAQQRNLSSDTS